VLGRFYIISVFCYKSPDTDGDTTFGEWTIRKWTIEKWTFGK